MRGSLKSCGEQKTQIMSQECVCLVDTSFLCFVDKRDCFAVIHVGMLEEGEVKEYNSLFCGYISFCTLRGRKESEREKV